ncbi:WUSCHEL-related homeobox 11-like [Prosopis cineraria]|uniref:WUSCHEL-related homeobox 11-like n=1 Tax=Prosopis cineraria TaxID=364024 RepID=UPI00240EF15A|nr:WUSCHEL-related homeobox 11-like [Prosopis cineraria]
MEDQGEGQQEANTPNQGLERSEPVRSRWTPKPEQILILESIFNSGMVNPPKEETIRIRKLLEKFGSVGDANVFYWFQNRRSRSRRRQRQMQASLEQRNQLQPQLGGAIPYDHQPHATSSSDPQHLPPVATVPFAAPSPTFPDLSGSSSSTSGMLGGQEALDGLFSVASQIGFPEFDHSSALYPPPTHASTFNYHSGLVTVFINGVATEVPRGPLDIKTMFGQDLVLVHSSGVPLPTNEFGFLMQSLQHGESYFLVSKPT